METIKISTTYDEISHEDKYPYWVHLWIGHKSRIIQKFSPDASEDEIHEYMDELKEDFKKTGASVKVDYNISRIEKNW